MKMKNLEMTLKTKREERRSAAGRTGLMKVSDNQNAAGCDTECESSTGRILPFSSKPFLCACRHE